MRKTLVLAVFAAFVAFAPAARVSAAVPSGSLIKASGPAVYYVSGGKRYVFSNEKVYFSWYHDFSSVVTISDQELASFLIGGNVTYRPGTKLVKIVSDPKVYVIGPGGTLRWIATEEAAKALFGNDWAKHVDDIPDAFFVNYRFGADVAAMADFDASEASKIGDIESDLSVRSGAPVVATQDFTAKQLGTWSDSKTWGGKVPGAGARVVVPEGIKVIFDAASTPNIRSVDVRGTLEFWKDSKTPLSLTTKTVRISGTLRAGTEDTPTPKRASVTIHLIGALAAPDEDDGIIVRGGSIELHGEVTQPAWTTDTAADVDTSRTVAVVGTGNGSGARLSVTDGGTLRLGGVELRGLGKAGVAGMGAITLDGLGDASGSYIKGSVLRDTARCVSLRRVDAFTIEDTVALKVRGTCFSTETGSETGNVFRHNLVVGVEKGSASTNDDVPAAFLLRNADNLVSGNAAVDSAGHGYWYWLGQESSKLNGTVMRPMASKLALFKDNSVRGAAKSGLFIDDPTGTFEYTPSEKAVFSGLQATQSGDYGFWARGSNIEVTGATLGDNRIGGSFAAFGATLKDSVITGDLDVASSTLPWQRGFLFQEGPVALSGVTFRHFMPDAKRDAAAFGFAEGADKLMDPLNSLRNVTLQDARAWSAGTPKTLADNLAAVRDLDAKKSVVMKAPFLGAGCDAAEGNVYVCDATFSQLQVAFRDISSAHGATFERLDGHGSVSFEPGASFDGIYAYLTVAEGGAYRMKAGFTSHVSFDYSGTKEPVTMRFAVGANVKVKTGLGSVWTYDKASSDLTLAIAPGDYVDVTW